MSTSKTIFDEAKEVFHRECRVMKAVFTLPNYKPEEPEHYAMNDIVDWEKVMNIEFTLVFLSDTGVRSWGPTPIPMPSAKEVWSKLSHVLSTPLIDRKEFKIHLKAALP